MAHPTGFPLYLLAGKLASLLPFGHVAFRINLVSAACAAVTTALTFRLILRLVGRGDPLARAGATAGALLLWGGSTFWLHATTAEVYLPNLLGLVVLLDLLAADDLSGRAGRLRAAAVVTGLGAGLHAATFAITALVAWLVIFGRRLTGPARARLLPDLGWTVSLTGLGALVVAYLPIRDATHPWRSWGDVSTAGGLWDHLTGARIRDAYALEMAGGGRLQINLELAVGQLATQVSWPGLVAACMLPLLAIRPGRRHWGLLLLGIWLGDIFYTALLNPMGIHDRQTGLIAIFATAVVFGIAMAGLGRRWFQPAFRSEVAAPMLVLAALALAAPAVLYRGDLRDLRRLYAPQDLADVTFDNLWPRAMLLVSTDDLASTTTYAQGVENRRPDVPVLVKQHATDPDAVAALQRHHGEGVLPEAFLADVEAGRSPVQALRTLLETLADRRAMAWELGDVAVDALVSERARLDLPVLRLYGPGLADLTSKLYGLRARWRALGTGPWHETSLQTLARLYSITGTHLLRAGDPLRAAQAIGEAFFTYAEDPAVVNNFALLLMRQGKTATARGRLEDLVKLRPDYALGWYNLGVTAFDMADRPAATLAFAEAARAGLDRRRLARAAWYLAVLNANEGHEGQALALVTTALPDLPPEERRAAQKMLQALLHP